MMVVDASAVLEMLLQTPRGMSFRLRVEATEDSLNAPHLLDVEVLQVLRRYQRSAQLDERRGWDAIQDLLDLPITRHPHDLLIVRAWQIRANLSAYDAMYVALAELLHAPLITADRRLAKSVGHTVKIELA